MQRFLITACVVALWSPAVHAQSVEMSDEELLNRLGGQLEAMEERTRGLSLVTGSGSTATTDTAVTGAGTVTGDDGLTPLADIKTGAASGTVILPETDTANRIDDDLEINIQIKFEFDSASLAASEQPALQQMCRVMQKATSVRLFQIIGHTDSAGSEAYNKRLSKLRAEEVGRYLTTECGIDRTRLRTVGYGEEFPDNTLDPLAPENRRVELQVLG